MKKWLVSSALLIAAVQIPAMAQMVLDSVNQALAGERPAMSLTT